MRPGTPWLSWAVAIIWLALVVACLLAGLTVLAVVVLVAPGVVFVVGLIGLRLYWRRHPEHRRIGDWFTEEHHIRHW